MASLLQIVLAIGIIGGIFVAPFLFVWASYAFDWGWTGFAGQTLWDWLKLLFVPLVVGLVVAFVGIWFNRQQATRDNESAKRSEQEGALQAYLDNMTALIVEQNLRAVRPKGKPPEDWEALLAVARARTLTVLRVLDGNRRGSVVRFLYEAHLITKDKSAISLEGAILLGANLNAKPKTNADRETGETLRDADLSGSYLAGATLWNTNLTGADLSRSFLLNADLNGANLTNADLNGAIGIRGEELRQQASALNGATMPNGQKYEDWRKSREEGGG